MSLEEYQLAQLVDLIRNSFRIHPNEDPPVYVDVGENLNRVLAPQHQVIYGSAARASPVYRFTFTDRSPARRTY